MSQSEYRSNQDGSITLTVPLEITVRLGVGGRNKMEPTVPNGTGIGGERVVPDRPYTNRNGYDPGFLPGFNVPFPRITSSAPGSPARLIQPTNGEDPTILKYEHFSVVMNADRKLAFVTAVNIDGAKSRSVDRRTGKVRPGIAERVMETVSESAEASETWYVDPRIPAEAQTDQSLYNSQRPHIFDRGHQVRREDPNWVPTEKRSGRTPTLSTLRTAARKRRRLISRRSSGRGSKITSSTTPAPRMPRSRFSPARSSPRTTRNTVISASPRSSSRSWPEWMMGS